MRQPVAIRSRPGDPIRLETNPAGYCRAKVAVPACSAARSRRTPSASPRCSRRHAEPCRAVVRRPRAAARQRRLRRVVADRGSPWHPPTGLPLASRQGLDRRSTVMGRHPEPRTLGGHARPARGKRRVSAMPVPCAGRTSPELERPRHASAAMHSRPGRCGRRVADTCLACPPPSISRTAHTPVCASSSPAATASFRRW